jgi:hypothetical protein
MDLVISRRRKVPVIYIFHAIIKKQSFCICPIENSIRTNIKDANADFDQMARSISHGFIHYFDDNFVRNTDFKLTSFTDKEKPELLQFSYVSGKYAVINDSYYMTECRYPYYVQTE